MDETNEVELPVCIFSHEGDDQSKDEEEEDFTLFLPDEILVHLLSFFEAADVLSAQRVCRRFDVQIRKNFFRMRKFEEQVDIRFEGSFIRLKPKGEIETEGSTRPRKFIYTISHQPEGGSFDVFDSEFPNLRFVGEDKGLLNPLREVQLSTSSSLKEAVENLLVKITSRFTFTEIEFGNVNLPDFLSIFQTLQGISSIIFHKCQFREADVIKVLKASRASNLRIWAAGEGQESFSVNFFKEPEVKRLRSFIRDGNSGLRMVFWSVDDDAFRGFEKMEALILPVVATRITPKGMKRVLGDWAIGRHQRWKAILLEMDKDDQSIEEFMCHFHNCEELCRYNTRTGKYDHVVSSVDGWRRLHLRVEEGDFGFMVHVQQCAQPEPCVWCPFRSFSFF